MTFEHQRGVGAQLPAEDRPAQPGWRPGGDLTPLEEKDLTPLEKNLVAAAVAGEPVDPGGGTFDLAEMQMWGAERTIHAAVLRHLLVADQWPLHAKGVRLHRVRISGPLDLEAAAIRYPLSLDCCYLEADICLNHATALRVTLTGCQLAGLTGEMLSVRELDLKNSTLTGPLQLMGAEIAGRLICRGTKLNGVSNDYSLDAEWMKVGGAVFLDDGFTAVGGISLRSAQVGASVWLAPDKLATHSKVAFDATRARIKGTLQWAPAKPVAGQVNLEGATAGHLVCCVRNSEGDFC